MTAKESQSTERGRPVLDYLRFVAWCGPGLLVSCAAHILLVPRLEKVIENSPTDSESLATVGKLITELSKIILVYSVVLLFGSIVVIVILESSANWWRQRRRSFLTIIAWIFHVMVLLGLFSLATCALLFATT